MGAAFVYSGQFSCWFGAFFCNPDELLRRNVRNDATRILNYTPSENNSRILGISADEMAPKKARTVNSTRFLGFTRNLPNLLFRKKTNHERRRIMRRYWIARAKKENRPHSPSTKAIFHRDNAVSIVKIVELLPHSLNSPDLPSCDLFHFLT